MKYILLPIAMMAILSACVEEERQLPIYGEVDIVEGDTIYHTIRDFTFMDQDSQIITNETFADHIYIADFFFTTCPTICPKVKQQLIRVRDAFPDEGRLKFLSHSIDTRRDSVPTLRKFADKLNISSDRWHLVTGDKKDLYDIAEDYFSIAKEDPNAPGGYDHSGYIILVDKNRHIRAYCDGTDPDKVDAFMKDIQKLIDEIDEG